MELSIGTLLGREHQETTQIVKQAHKLHVSVSVLLLFGPMYLVSTFSRADVALIELV
jgi:hypothetical protein